MSLVLPKTCSMGSSKTGLVGTIGVTLLNPDGTVHTARITVGIYEIGGGCYGKNVTFPDDWKGIIQWDTVSGTLMCVVEEYVIEGIGDTIRIKTDNLSEDPADQSLVEAAITISEDSIKAGSETLQSLSDKLDTKPNTGQVEGLKIETHTVSEFFRGKPATLVIMVTFNGVPLSGVVVKADIYKPDDALYLGDQTLNELGSTGIYTFTYTVDLVDDLGVYKVKISCSYEINGTTFTDDFEAGSDNFIPYGNWLIEDEGASHGNVYKLVGEYTSGYSILESAESFDWRDYSFECDVRRDHDQQYAFCGISGRWQDNNTKYYFYLYPSNNTLKLSGGGLDYETAFAVEYDVWYRMKIVFAGRSIKCYVDDQLYIDVVDPTPIEFGKICINANNFGASFDNVSVVVSGTVYNSYQVKDYMVEDQGQYKADVGALALESTLSGLPTAAEIDTELTSSHGAGSWQAGTSASGEYDDRLDLILDTQIIRTVKIIDIAPTLTTFETDLTESIDDYWNRGAVKFISGQNEGVIRKIQNYAGSTKEIVLRTPLPYVPAMGDVLVIIPLRCFRLNYADVTVITEDMSEELTSSHGAGSWQTGTSASGEYDDRLSAIQDDLDTPDQYKADVSELSLITTSITRILGLVQENFYLDNMFYTEHNNVKLLTDGRLRLYSNAGSVGTDNDVVATYTIASNWLGDELQTYKVVKN